MHLSSNVTNYTFSTQEKGMEFSQSFVPYLKMKKKNLALGTFPLCSYTIIRISML